MKRVRLARIILALLAFLLGASSGFSQTQSRKLGAAPPQKKLEGAATTDLSRLKLRRNVLAIRLEKGFFEVVEMMDFENEGSAAIVSKDGAPTLRFALPGSSSVRSPRARWTAAPVGLDSRFLTSAGDELRTSEPIPPGRKFIVLTYRLADEFGGIRIEKPILYDTPNFAILPEKNRVQASAPGFSAAPALTFRDREYDRFEGIARAGEVVRIDVQAPDSTGGLGVFYVVGGLVAASGLGLGFYIRKRRNAALSARAEREEILRAIAQLDDRLARGEISPDEHVQERAPRFSRLRELSA